MGTLDDHPRFVGYYTQPYNDIIQSKQIWHVSKYLLRRWGPYLSSARFWAVVAAQQMAYWNNKTDWFTAYDGQMAHAAHLSSVHYRRIKAELNDRQNPISLFLTRGKTEYHVVDGLTRPKPTVYHVRLDDPLTPADAHHLTTWLQAHNLPRRANEVAVFLQDALQIPRHELLSSSVGPYLADCPAQFLPLTVQDLIGRVYGASVAQSKAVKQQAESLHRYLTQPEYIGKQYFRRHWLNRLKPGPAFLITYLRSLCYDNEQTGERREQVTFTRPELADRLGITTKTLASWLRKLENAAAPQTFAPFLTLSNKQRISSNEVAYTYHVALIDPLVESDLPAYKAQMQAFVAGPKGNNERHETAGHSMPNGKIERHDTLDAARAEGKIERHGQNDQTGSEGKNERHDGIGKEEMIRGEDKNDQGSRKKRAAYKYYKTLYQALMTEETLKETFASKTQSGAWKVADGLAELPVAQAAAGGVKDRFYDLIGVDTTAVMRRRLERGGDLNSIAAWYLYARQQEGLTQGPVALTIRRVVDGQIPPQRYLALASLSWELWRCYAALLLLPPLYRDAFRSAPEFAFWMKEYGRFHPDDLPFGVGAGLAEEIPTWLYNNAGPAQETEDTVQMPKTAAVPQQHVWRQILAQLQLSMNRIAFQTWLASSRLLLVEEGKGGERWTVGLESEQAVQWVAARVNKGVIEPMAAAIYGQMVVIEYCVENRKEFA